MSNDILSNDKNRHLSEKPVSTNINDENLFTIKAENKQNEFDCSCTICECSRCKNMNGN